MCWRVISNLHHTFQFTLMKTIISIKLFVKIYLMKLLIHDLLRNYPCTEYNLKSLIYQKNMQYKLQF